MRLFNRTKDTVSFHSDKMLLYLPKGNFLSKRLHLYESGAISSRVVTLVSFMPYITNCPSIESDATVYVKSQRTVSY